MAPRRPIVPLLLAVLAFLPGVLPAQSPDPARPLSKDAVERLVALTRLAGYIRHFHPSDQVERADWDLLLATAVGVAERATDPASLAAALEDHFITVAPTVRVFPDGLEGGLPRGLRPERASYSGLIFWEHRGLGAGGRGGHFVSRRLRFEFRGTPRPRSVPSPTEPWRAQLGAGISCSVPLSVYCNASQTLPVPDSARNPLRKLDAARARSLKTDLGNRETRLACVMAVWNAVQHFHPRNDPEEWMRLLRKHLGEAATQTKPLSFFMQIRRLLRPLEDGNVATLNRVNRDRWAPEVMWTSIGDRLVVLEARAPASEFVHAGDVVKKIDGTPVAARLAALEPIVSGSTAGHRRHWQLLEMLLGPKDRPLKLEIERAGKTMNVTLERTHLGPIRVGRRPEKIQEVEPGIWYVDMTRIGDWDFDKHLARLKTARGLIVDLRGDIRQATDYVFAHFHDAPLKSPRMRTAVARKPDRKAHEWLTGGWEIAPVKPYLAAPKVFLCDTFTRSGSEVYAAMVRYGKVGELFGTTTAGAAAHPTGLRFPGGFNVGWSGQLMITPDGKTLAGHGVAPTRKVVPSLDDARRGADAPLQAALAHLRK